MSKRRGDVVLLDELMDYRHRRGALVPPQRSHDQTIELDIDLAREQSAQNPVYYVQYAHARIAAIERAPASARGRRARSGAARPSRRGRAGARARRVPARRGEAADLRAPHRIAAYAPDLAADFHASTATAACSTTPTRAHAQRLALFRAARGVLASSLDLLGRRRPGGDVSVEDG